ncbi:MAG: hypothetical protein ACSLFP_11420 [Acidimicrobiales bacterium]
MSALRRFLLMSLTLAVVGGLTYLVSERLDLGDGGNQVVSGPDGTVAAGSGDTTTTTVTAPTEVPAPGQTRVTGTVTAVHLEDAVLDPRDVPTPLTIVSDRGFGNGAELSGVLVDGAAASVVWDGGRPFVLTSGGSLVLDPVTVDLVAEGVQLTLGGAVHQLAPGTYQLDTPVAVGAAGFGSARDAVVFTADDGSLLDANGDAAIVLDPESGARRFLGPGSVRLEGTLEVTDADGSRPARTIDAAAGAFELTLTPAPGGGWTVEAVLEGEATGS